VTDTVSVSAGPPVVQAGYQAALQEAYEQRKYAVDGATARQELEDVMRIIRDGGVNPVVVIDDTDKFADATPGGLDPDAVDGLFNNAIRLLADLSIDFVVAVHPRFEESPAYVSQAERLLGPRIEIPFLPIERQPIRQILEKHLEAKDIAATAEEVITAEALTALWGIYSNGRDVRDVMHVAHDAGSQAAARGADVIEGDDVSTAMRSRAGR
jgi:Cdc6-like AAA superfamily ATPase